MEVGAPGAHKLLLSQKRSQRQLRAPEGPECKKPLNDVLRVDPPSGQKPHEFQPQASRKPRVSAT